MALTVERKEAIHPHWTGALLLSTTDNVVLHEESRSKGVYERSKNAITIHWESYGSDKFVELSGIYVHQHILDSCPAIDYFCAVKAGTKALRATRASFLLPDFQYEVELRLGTSDIPTFIQIFIGREYESQNLPRSANTIVDLGANIGLATAFFGLKYPNARVLAVEPSRENFSMLCRNTAALGDRVYKRQGAVWGKDGILNLQTEDTLGRPLGAWGLQVTEEECRSQQKTACFKVTTLLEREGFGDVDILKCDIEGAELEIFSTDAAEWLPRVELIIVETHDRFRPGSEEAVRRAVDSTFEELPPSGENLFFRRHRRRFCD